MNLSIIFSVLMKKIGIWVFLLVSMWLVAGQALAQAQGGAGFFGGGRAGAREARNEARAEMREAARERFRQHQFERSGQVPGERSVGNDPAANNPRFNNRDVSDPRTERPDAGAEGFRRGRLTIEERRALRRQIREAGNDIYNRQR